MPTYVYEVLDENGEPIDSFECVEKMTDEPLTEHPETGQPVRRVFLPVRIAGKNAPFRTDRTLNDDSKLERLGFSKYVKGDDGKYEKAVGKGPDLLKK